MTCPNCGAYGEPDRETGYDVDTLCPDCIAAGFTSDADGSVSLTEPSDITADDDDNECPF
jgi:hypothetical protein